MHMLMPILAPHRNSNIETQLPDRAWQDLNNARDDLYSRVYMVKLTLKFLLNFPEAIE